MMRVSKPLLVSLASCIVVPAVYADSLGPNEWLSRMSQAVQTTNYEATVMRMQGDKTEALKVYHQVSNGVIRERVTAQEGNGIEIIRIGNEVHCILPDSRSVLVEQWDDRSTLFSTLPSSDLRFGNEYDVAVVRNDRVAGRKTVLLAIRPHDHYRFGHRIWLDVETGLPLRTQLIGVDGKAIEEVKFADILVSQEITASELQPTYRTDNFKWYNEPQRSVTKSVKSTWTVDLPAGFHAISEQQEQLPGNDSPVTHILYSDGLASVSVFVAMKPAGKLEGQSRIGLSNSFTAESGNFQFTAVGQVPVATVQKIAQSMRVQATPAE